MDFGATVLCPARVSGVQSPGIGATVVCCAAVSTGHMEITAIALVSPRDHEEVVHRQFLAVVGHWTSARHATVGP